MTVVLTDWADAVEQHDGELDGVDPREITRSIRAMVPAPPRTLMALTGRLEASATIVVPYLRVGEGSVSDYVYAVKRARARRKGGGRLALLMSRPLAVRRTWGPAFSRELGSNEYTLARHETLGPFFDALALELARRAVANTRRAQQIARATGWVNAIYNRRMSVAYSQARPSQIVAADRVTRADCSGSVAGACAWADILPAVDWRYTNTWSQITFGRPVSDPQHAIPGDVFLYGSPSHEAMYLGDGLVFSFGSYPAKILAWNYRGDLAAIRRFVPLGG